MNTALLTIDDTPSRNTPALVDFLKEKNIRPILFSVGENIEKHYQEALYAVKQGFILGNHSYSHQHFSLLSPEEAISDIEKCEALLEMLYRDAGIPRLYRPFRFPYGDKGEKNKAALQQYLKERAFDKVDDTMISFPWWKEHHMDTDVDTFWTFDFEEYQLYLNPEFTLKTIWDKIHDRNPKAGAALFAENHRHILLMHDHDETESLLPGYYRLFLDALLQQGLTFDSPRFLKPSQEKSSVL